MTTMRIDNDDDGNDTNETKRTLKPQQQGIIASRNADTFVLTAWPESLSWLALLRLCTTLVSWTASQFVIVR